MGTLNMLGSYKLNLTTIDNVVTRTSPGNYALGKAEEEKFYVSYVGRSDNDINNRLKSWIGKYSDFKFSYASSAKAAFEKECNTYHDFGGNNKLANSIHPDRPQNTTWKCPQCKIFE